ncbi:hypothetical protein [Sorangium sp. So ce388]|uniref:hypothetical protein n=1 Tax=Sorangium sp. So ce388 TaxID=3133309 RepID=UPI003F5CAD1E
MGDGSSPERKFLEKLGVGDDLLTLFDTAKTIAGVVSTVYAGYGYVVAAYGLAESILQKLGVLEPEKSQLALFQEHVDRLFAKIYDKLESLTDLVNATNVENNRRTIAQELGSARAALGSIVVKLKNGEGLGEQRDISLHDSLAALETLDQSVFWHRPYFDGWVYRNSWVGALPPPHGGSVFDYRFILPAYLEAINLRIVILGLSRIEYRSQSGSLNPLADKLLSIHDKILEAIVPLRPPSEEEIAPRYAERVGSSSSRNEPWSYVPSDQLIDLHRWELQRAIWDVRGRWYGAVELYSAMDGTEAYPAEPFPAPPEPPSYATYAITAGPDLSPNSPPRGSIVNEEAYKKAKQNYDIARTRYESSFRDAYDRFLVKHAVRTLKRRKEVYRAVGLPAIWQMAGSVKQLAGEPPPEGSHFGLWSLREASDVVHGAARGSLRNQLGSGVSVRSLAAALGSAAPVVSLRRLFES